MADIVDTANDRADNEHASNVVEVRQLAAQIPAGVPGDCEYCGEWSGRLVHGVCAPCRDRLGLA